MKEGQHDEVAAWVALAPRDQVEFRQAVHTILAAIAQDTELQARMIMKGGLLLAVRYQSARFTKDIDFSTSMKLGEIDPDGIRSSLERSLIQVVETLDYGLDCRVQGCRVNPPNRPDASFPSIELKVGYAYKGTSKHRRLMNLQSPSVVSIDYSLNEMISASDQIFIGINGRVNTYPLADLVAEKIRALLQQIDRDRYRRQDVYDLVLLSRLPRDGVLERAILESLLIRARSRDIEPNLDSLNNVEVKRRAAAEYQTLKDEIHGELPDFESAYAEVLAFYRALPWELAKA